MSLKHFKFWVQNTRTKRTFAFLGQGETVAEAWREGLANTQAIFRARDGKGRENGITVRGPDENDVEHMTLQQFEREEQATNLKGKL